MTETIHLELPREEAEKLLPIFEQRRDRLTAELKNVNKQIAAIRGVAPLAPKGEHPPSALSKKAQAKAAIVAHLKTLPAVGGQSITDISKGAGVSYGSTYRALQDMKESGEADDAGKLWKLTH